MSPCGFNVPFENYSDLTLDNTVVARTNLMSPSAKLCWNFADTEGVPVTLEASTQQRKTKAYEYNHNKRPAL